MKKLIFSVIATLLTVVGLTQVASFSPAYAAEGGGGSGGTTGGNNTTVVCPDGTSVTSGANYETACQGHGVGGGGIYNNNDMLKVLNTVLNVVVGLVGFVSIAMMIIGGISFATSQGDTAKTTRARNTLIYGIAGLVISLLAFAIVNFVLSNVFSS